MPFSAVAPLSPTRRLARFVAVGAVAAAVHWGVVVALVGQWGWRPAVANLPAWLLAFTVSWAGHHRWTFGDRATATTQTAPRFFLVSALGFAVNETAYVLLLHSTTLRYDAVLAGILLAVAGLTYLASRHWAFRGNGARPPASPGR